MKIIKRNGSEADFDLNKIVVAVSKANAACRKEELTQSQIVEIAEYVEFKMSKANRALSVEEIQDIVENQIMAQGAFEVARLYVKYRYNRSLIRKANTTDNQILSLIECNNEEIKILLSIPFSVTIWQARYQRILLKEFFCLRILLTLTSRA